MSEQDSKKIEEIKDFYDSVYHRSARAVPRVSGHYRRLVRKVGVGHGDSVLDIACGAGEWLLACKQRGANVSGIDLSERAIEVCRELIPDGEFRSGPAEKLPFEDARFDCVTCLGSLEHFVNQEEALREMRRVAKDGARILILVPNADFLTRKTGLFAGTYQVDAKEDVRTLEGWEALFSQVELRVMSRWRDLHVLDWRWISASKWYLTPLRALQAIALVIWPLRWQYQVYHLCRFE